MKFNYDFTSLPVLLAAAACALMVVGFAVMLVLASSQEWRWLCVLGMANDRPAGQ